MQSLTLNASFFQYFTIGKLKFFLSFNFFIYFKNHFDIVLKAAIPAGSTYFYNVQHVDR